MTNRSVAISAKGTKEVREVEAPHGPVLDDKFGRLYNVKQIL